MNRKTLEAWANIGKAFVELEDAKKKQQSITAYLNDVVPQVRALEQQERAKIERNMAKTSQKIEQVEKQEGETVQKIVSTTSELGKAASEIVEASKPEEVQT